MTLNPKQLKYLKGLGQKLRPLVLVGKEGLSEPLLKELDLCLSSHELVKVRIGVEEREAFLALVADLAKKIEAHLVQTIGRMALFYRASPPPSSTSKKRPKITLPPG